MVHEPEPARRLRTPSQHTNESPMKPKLVKADAKAAKLDRALVKTTEQRDEARNQLKVVNSHLKRSQDSLEAANKRIGSLETTISKLKEKPVPPPKMHDNSDLKDLVSKSVKQILEEIKCVRTCHTHLQEAVSALANAPIEITQPTAPQIPAAPRPPPLSAIPQRWQPMSESPSGFQQIVSRDEYHEFAPPARAQNEYWPVPDDRYGAPNRFVPAAYGTPDQIGQRHMVEPLAPAPTQFHVRRVLPPGFGMPIAPVESEDASAQASSERQRSTQKRGKK